VPLKKVISFALWGDNPLYVNGAAWNAKHRVDFYPDWVCRFYHDDSVPEEILEKIRGAGAEMRLMGRTADVLGMFWRFHPMFDDPEIGRFIVRDTDSKFCAREAKMVGEWVDSGKPFHIIRDCESHATQILGGTWGAIPGCVPGFEEKLGAWFTNLRPDNANPRGLYHGSDQIFLASHVWPVIKDNHLAHVRANLPQLKYTGAEIEVPDPEDGHFIGMVC
jgi:hypothetical protein